MDGRMSDEEDREALGPLLPGWYQFSFNLIEQFNDVHV